MPLRVEKSLVSHCATDLALMFYRKTTNVDVQFIAANWDKKGFRSHPATSTKAAELYFKIATGKEEKGSIPKHFESDIWTKTRATRAGLPNTMELCDLYAEGRVETKESNRYGSHSTRFVQRLWTS
jgi:hypothetical protein